MEQFEFFFKWMLYLPLKAAGLFRVRLPPLLCNLLLKTGTGMVDGEAVTIEAEDGVMRCCCCCCPPPPPIGNSMPKALIAARLGGDEVSSASTSSGMEIWAWPTGVPISLPASEEFNGIC
jgi:hypothetical protein